ncbi:2,3-bisphosphoglycerate-dependent phosphoglycerate mutase [Paenibacillaceae bacterium GAS479]|nr:2,3-bisphosphoglycerate-dependent phosphoglycerate mutase [Paenibacillaceae bacterium GAS479]
MITTLYLIRHAESVYRHGEERNRGLSEKGHLAASRVATLLSKEDIRLIVSSPYERVIQTVKPLAELSGLTIQTHEELRERSIVGFDLEVPWEQCVEAIRISFADKDYALSGGETTNEAQQRVIPVIERLLGEHGGQGIAVGTHGNIMTILLNYFDPSYEFEFWQAALMPDVYKLSFSEGRLMEVQHLWKVGAEGDNE